MKPLHEALKGARMNPVNPKKTPVQNGPKIDDLRWDRRLSVSELANKAGITPQYLRRIFKGERRASLVVQQSLADALNVPISEIQQ